MNNSIKNYMRDLKIVKNNLTKFYYHSASEWLKYDIYQCIKCVDSEILRYERITKNYEEENKRLITIFDFKGSVN